MAAVQSALLNGFSAAQRLVSYLGEYVTWTFSPNNNGIAHQGRAG
jgi:hypothetical protein